MRLRWIYRSGLLAAALAFSVAAYGQAPPPGPRHGGGPMEFGRFEMGLMGRTVTGAPYSAQIVSQRSQTLSDGTHVTQQSTGAVYRDSAGRVRREMSMPALGSLTGSAQARHVVFISDPVAGYHYVLHEHSQTVDRMPMPPAGAAKERGTRPPRNGEQVVKESLGTQTIEGVTAEGTRITKTIPVGAIGNDKAIQIVTERWYSPDLQTVVLVKHSDPWMGESTVRLTNISRTEPAASLFAVPSNYAVNDRPAPPSFGRRIGGPPPRD
jgi:hypothetical protein